MRVASHRSFPGGPLLFINEVINGYNIYKWPYKWVPGVIATIGGLILTIFITGRVAPCTRVALKNTATLLEKLFEAIQQKLVWEASCSINSWDP